jgi:hypothetical protein
MEPQIKADEEAPQAFDFTRRCVDQFSGSGGLSGKHQEPGVDTEKRVLRHCFKEDMRLMA